MSSESPAVVDPAEFSAAVEMPKPNEGAIAASIADAQASAPTTAPAGPSGTAPTRVDAAGEAFNPAIHKPYFAEKGARKGRWVRLPQRERGDAPPVKPAPAPVTSVVGDAPGAPAPQVADRYAAAAEAYCKTGYALLGMAFGAVEEWVPENDSEHRALCDAVSNYLRTTGTVDLPPGVTLALVAGTYAAPRLVKPKTRAKLAAGWEWLRAKKTPPAPVAPAVPLPTTTPKSPDGTIRLNSPFPLTAPVPSSAPVVES